MNILHLDSSPSGDASVSRLITADAVRVLAAQAGGNAVVAYRDLAAEPLAHLGGELLRAMRPEPGAPAPDSAAVRAELALTEEVLAEFLAADAVVVGAPMYNFSVPTQLKAWIDRIAQAGRTFRYTERGFEGLAGGKRVVVVSSRGGRWSGVPAETAMDHQEAYLRAIFGFIGVTDFTVVRAEGLNMGPASRDQAIAAALAMSSELSARVG